MLARYRYRADPTSGQERMLARTFAKTTPQRAWLSEVASVQAGQVARRAYRNFLDSCPGRRKGRTVGRPRFRSRKDDRQWIRRTRNGFGVISRGVRMAKVGNVGPAETRNAYGAEDRPGLIPAVGVAAGTRRGAA